MRISEGIQLIESGFPKKITNSVWADLGCGSGLFTKALAAMLGTQSKIFALDKTQQSFEPNYNHVAIEFIKIDFETDSYEFKNLDGVLMANSLHYVKDKSKLISKIKRYLKPDGQLLIIEYEMEKSNHWVPFPIRYDQLIELLSDNSFDSFKMLGERPSVYQAEKMYACLAKAH